MFVARSVFCVYGRDRSHDRFIRGFEEMPLRISLALIATILCGCSPGLPSASKVPSKASEDEVLPAAISASARERTNLNFAASIRLATFPHFEDVAEVSNLSFTYDNGSSPRVLMIEASGGGAGWLDYDSDGLLDLYLCQGGNPTGQPSDLQPLDQLFRQVQLGRFEPVTVLANVIEPHYSQGVSIADFNDDGFDDIYVTNVGPNTLFRNQGDGTFEDVSIEAGVANPLWSTSSAWGDLDGDGDLDLYLCNYVAYDVFNPTFCVRINGTPGTCHPKDMTAVPDECYINQGDGHFTAEANIRGLVGLDNKGLGVVIADLTNDGLPDVYVTNDTSPNFLFVNHGEGRFQESGKLLGCAVSREGHPQASMGVASGDYDQNGWLDLYCTHFTKESNTLYKNLGPSGFQDVTGLVGLHVPTLPFLGFGTIMADFNQDGHEDLFVANGHVDDWSSQGDLYRMPAQLFSFEGSRFVECTSKAGEYFQRDVLGRGVARGDFDNDGDWDLVAVNQNSPTALLRNDSARGNWVKVRCIAIANRRGVGTRVLLFQGTRKLTQELIGGNSYCAAHEQSLIFGLGPDSQPCNLEIRWPNGVRQTVSDVRVNQSLVIRQSESSTIAIVDR
jgi:hypothetical protein